MQINKVTIAIRPRENWETVDLGLRMVQHWWRAIYAPWLIVTTCIAAALFFLCWQFDMLWLYVVLFWWFKPLYGRIPLYVLSRTVFGEQLTTIQTLQAVPRLFMISPLWHLLLFRFSWMRCVDLPVVILEGLKGEERRERLRLLRRTTAGTTALVTSLGLLLQLHLHFSILLLIVIFIPENIHMQWNHILFPFEETIPVAFKLIATGVFTLSIILLEPFYIAAGFSLYLNRRTLLEGWDIELAFHRMITRLQLNGMVNKVASLLVCVVLALYFTLLTPVPAYAANTAPTATEAKNHIESILQTEEFNRKKTIEYYKYKHEQEEKAEKKGNDNALMKLLRAVGQFIAIIFKSVLWILLFVAIIWLAINHERWLNWIRGIKPAPRFIPPKQLFGLDLRPESLPDNIGAYALNLLREGKLREALSILYRGALSRLATRDAIQLKESFTEGDCLREVKRIVNRNKSNYFSNLTYAWQMIAYANRSPTAIDIENLCSEFAVHFEVVE